MELSDVKRAWAKYKSIQVFSVLRNGKWEDKPLLNGERAPRRVEGTAAKIQSLKNVMEFPEYLEKHWVKQWMDK